MTPISLSIKLTQVILRIEKIGKMELTLNSKTYILSYVLFIPKLEKNLISTHKLCCDIGCSVKLIPSSFIIKELKTKRLCVLGIA